MDDKLSQSVISDPKKLSAAEVEYVPQPKNNSYFGSRKSFKSLIPKQASSDSLLFYFTVLAVDLLAASGDTTASWTSPMYPKLHSNDSSINPIGRPITSEEDSWIGSIINVGSLIGAIPAGFVADKFGRKNALLALAVPYITAYVTFAYATKTYWFLAARFWSGLSFGAGYAILPMYMAEISRDANRGAVSVTLGVFWAFGNFLPNCIGPYISIKTFNLILAGLPTLFFIAFYFFGTETPLYLIHQGRYEEAEKSLRCLRCYSNDDDVYKEIEYIKSTKHENGSLKEVWKDPALRYALFISLILIIINQFSGISVICYYMQTILELSESNIPSTISATICGVFLFLSSFTTIFVVEKMGRRIPLVSSLVGCALSLASLGMFFYLKNTSFNITCISWLPIFSILSYFICFNFGTSVLPWSISAELFPNSVKSVTSAAVSGMCWISAFIVTKFFIILNELIGEAGTFFILAGFCLLGSIFGFICVPETKGKNVSEIYKLLQKKSFFK